MWESFTKLNINFTGRNDPTKSIIICSGVIISVVSNTNSITSGDIPWEQIAAAESVCRIHEEIISEGIHDFQISSFQSGAEQPSHDGVHETALQDVNDQDVNDQDVLTAVSSAVEVFQEGVTFFLAWQFTNFWNINSQMTCTKFVSVNCSEEHICY